MTGPERGIALVFTLAEQFVTRALALADDVDLMNRGRIAYRGEPSELEDEDVFARYLGADLVV